MATFQLALAIGRPEVTVQSTIIVSSFKPEISGKDWLVKEATHTLNDSCGRAAKAQMELGMLNISKAQQAKFHL